MSPKAYFSPRENKKHIWFMTVFPVRLSSIKTNRQFNFFQSLYEQTIISTFWQSLLLCSEAEEFIFKVKTTFS